MAFKVALLCWKFSNLDDIVYEPELNHDFTKHDPLPTEAVQPIVAEAVARVKRCLAIQDGSTSGQQSIVNTLKFYYLEHENAYRVTLDIEALRSTIIGANEPDAFRDGLTNKQIEKLTGLLNEEFTLDGHIEATPLFKRGRTDKPHYLISSDDRVMEYDFDGVVYHERSEFQDIKIVSSPSLGNTLLLDNLQNLAEQDLEYTYALMDRGNVSYAGKEVLILGGGDGGLIWELLKEKPKFVTMAEIDPLVIEACRQHLKPCGQVFEQLETTNYKIIVDDCMRVLRASIKEGKKYDVIFNDLTDIPVTRRAESLTAFEPSAVQRDNPWHFIEAIFNLSLDCLAPNGLYMNHATGRGNRVAIEAYEEFLRNTRTKVEFESRERCVPSFMEIWMFYTVRRATSSQ